MRLTTVFMIAAIMQVSASGFAQRVTFKAKQGTLQELFKAIKTQTGYHVVMSAEKLEAAQPISADFKNEALEKVLEVSLEGQNLTYTIDKKTIVIREKEPSFLDNLVARFTDIDVRGRVVDEKGLPLPNASIRVKGKSAVYKSNESGEFEIKGVDEDAVLLVSYVGFRSLEIGLKDAVMPLEIKLNVATGELEEVNVTYNTGFQNLPKERTTGSFEFIDNKLINRSVSSNLLERFRDVSSGLLFNRNGLVNIRGRSTIFADQRPLIVINDFPYEGNIDDINPNDVEHITILKDAAAASIWGSKAGNGVIVITTKKGKSDTAPSIAFNSNVTFADKSDLYYPPTFNSTNYIEVERYLFDKGFYDSRINSTNRPGLTPLVELLIQKKAGAISDNELDARIEEFSAIDVRDDYTKYLMRNALNQQYSVNLQGGGINQKYFASVGYDKNLFETKGDEFNRITINANNTYSFFKNRLEINTQLQYAQINNINNGISPQSLNYGNDYKLYPYARLADASGNGLAIEKYRLPYIDTAGNGLLLDWKYRPLDELALNDNTSKSINYNLNAGLKFVILKGLDASFKYQYSNGNSTRRNHQDPESFSVRDYINRFSSINRAARAVIRPVPIGGILDIGNSNFKSQSFRSQLSFTKTWNDRHDVNAIAGYEVIDNNGTSNSLRLYGYNDESGGTDQNVNYLGSYKNFINGGGIQISEGNGIGKTTNRFVSYYANAAYSFDRKYTLTGSARKDASNLFGVATNQKGVPLWSAGLGYRVSEEKFYKIDWLPVLGLRATYGYNGNIVEDVTAFLTTVAGFGTNRYGVPFASISNPPNQDLRWEKVRNINLGVDFGLKNNRISGSFEYYWKKGLDLINGINLPPSSGLISYKGNFSNINTKGFDLKLRTLNIRSPFVWTSDILMTYSNTFLKDYVIDPVLTNRNIVTQNIPILSKPYDGLFSYKWAGLSPENGSPRGFVDGEVSSDYVKIQGSKNLNDIEYSGHTLPPLFGNLRNNFAYRNFSLSFNIAYRFNYVFRRQSINYADLFESGNGNQVDYLKRWMAPGDEQTTDIPALIYPTNTAREDFYKYSAVLIEKGDHIRLRDIGLDYTLNNFIRKKWFKTMNLYFYMSNIGILWRANKHGLDPDAYTLNDLVSPRTYAVGVKFNL